MLPDSAGKAFGHFGEERMDQIGNDEPDEGRSAGDQAPRGEIWPVANLLGSRMNSLPHAFADVGMVPESLGHGDHRDAEVTCDVLHLDCHGMNYTQEMGSKRGRFPAAKREFYVEKAIVSTARVPADCMRAIDGPFRMP